MGGGNMRVPAYVTTWGEIREGNKVLIMRRSAKNTASWATRIDEILKIEPSPAVDALTVTALKPPDKAYSYPREVTYLVEPDMLVTVVDSEEVT
jgi:hypothetical protein